MADKTNRLSLKVSVVFDRQQALKEAKKIQGELDRQSDKNFNKRKKQSDELTNKQKTFNKAQKESGNLLQKIGNEARKASTKFLRFLLVTQVFIALRVQFRKALELLFQLDTAFTNFAIVSKATASELVQVNNQVDTLSLELGKLKKEVIDTVTEFSRAGFSISESLTLAENAIKGANVGATSLANVTTFLIAGLKAFNLEAEESTRILDVLFRVANTTAINLEGIGEAFLRSANTLQTAGASLEESASLIAAANESIQDPAKVGTALKTIASRLRGVSEDGEAIPKLAESFNAVGISIQEADGSFRDIFDIFRDLANILPELDELTRESLLEKLAGKRQKNIIIALLNNFGTAEQALKDALNSTGEVALANEKFLDSLQGRTNQLKEAWNQLLDALANDRLVKVTVTALKNIVQFVTKLIVDVPNLAKAVAGLALAFAPLGGVVTVIGAIIGGLGALGTVLDITKSESQKLAETIGVLNQEIAELDSKIAEVEAIEDRNEAQERYLELLERERELKQEQKEQELLATSETALKRAQGGFEALTEQVADFRKEYKEALDSGNIEDLENLEGVLNANEEALISQISRLEEQNKTVRESSTVYQNNAKALEILYQILETVDETYIEFGLRVKDATSDTEDLNKQIEDQVTLLQQVRDLTSTASDDYELLSDALLALETDGYLTDDMLNTLIETYGDIISQTGLATDAFRDYVDSNKAKTVEEIDRLKKLAEAEIRTAQAIIASREAVTFAEQGYSTARQGTLAQVEALITNAENSIALLDNEIKQIEATEKARNDSINNSKKQVEVLSELELKLKNINFQIELQKKLLSRTDAEEEQIAINEELIGLYEQQREALLEQQRELEEQGKSLQKGTEEYDDYIEESYQLSLAIEDATNNIISFTKANAELNKTLEESELESLTEELEGLSESINDELQKQIDKQKELADASESYYEDLINSKKDELEALKASNEEREKQIELEELLQNLQDLRERRANILANKTARIVKDADVGFEFIADPEELRQVNEDILDAEKAIDDFRREQAFDQNVARLEATIEGLEAEAEAEQESYDERIQELETFQDEVAQSIDEGNMITENAVTTLAITLEAIEGESYKNRLASLQGFVSSYNSKLTELSNQQRAIEAIEASIRSTTSSIVNAQNIATGTGTGVSTSTTGSEARSSTTGNRVTGSGGSTSTTTTSINRINVNSNVDSIDGIVSDALSIADIAF